MKMLRNASISCGNKVFTAPLFCSITLIAALIFTGCQKNALNVPGDELSSTENTKLRAEAFITNNDQNLSFQTKWELQQARAATAKYQKINNAIADGYTDIAVDVENMGHHYMKVSLVDATFDIRQPEILVYNKDENGQQQLMAVEYAIPLSNPKPEGFSGADDVWDGNTGFGLWLLHAWVWYENPDGVFKPFNPLVHLH